MIGTVNVNDIGTELPAAIEFSQDNKESVISVYTGQQLALQSIVELSASDTPSHTGNFTHQCSTVPTVRIFSSSRMIGVFVLDGDQLSFHVSRGRTVDDPQQWTIHNETL